MVDDVTDAVGAARIDVVIATHRHQDHVYVFNAPEWDQVDVGEVWLPWVENPKNTEAQNLWKKQKSFAEQLSAALPGFELDAARREEVEFMLWNAGVDVPAAVGPFAAWSNAAALDRLHHGFARRDRAQPRFLPEGTAFPEAFESEALPGVRVHVLGPPRDADLIAEIDPKGDGETYRALALRAAEWAGQALPAPFGEDWTAPLQGATELSPDEVERLHDLARSADPLFAAQALDNMINSTSLVLVLQIGKARLLLAGDAEWGTWKVILDDAKARALLSGTNFVKIGHHGSHNATPKTLVEKVLGKGVRAMISTQEGPGNYRNDIPLPALLSALEKQGVKTVRSDAPEQALPKGFEREAGGRWIDLTLPC